MILFQTETIARRMLSRGGRTAGFEYLRILLAIGVIVFHSIVTSYGPDADGWLAQG